ncbi:MAG: hypothetical protein ACFFBP_11090 [Promethearchaeota archaeon]
MYLYIDIISLNNKNKTVNITKKIKKSYWRALKITSEEEGNIKQGTIAGFMRKRTQLVGFEMGYWKHVQYCAEFIDNALDAIEAFQWKELEKEDSKITFTLDRDLEIQNLSLINNKTKIEELKTSEDESGEIIDKDQIEVEAEVQRIIDDMEEILQPLGNLIDVEPIVIIRMRETEAPSFLTSELGKKNVMNFTFEIFDNGTGMAKVDLRKFGKYLASSKSVELKQTRGSQGFGSPSAFSDAQNTTGRPIVAVSKSADSIYAIASEFFTTSKNEKKYLVHPSEVDSQFLHGTYIKLNYLNVKYVRGYVETYIKETAFLNPHVTIVFIDPFGEEWIYPRLVSSFPSEPKYAKPHPSSTNIGDLQDLLTKSDNLTISAFLQDNFVRVSSKIAKKVIKLATKDLQDKLNLLILKNGYITKIEKKTDPIYYMRDEHRVFGKSTKPRDKLIIYEVQSEELKEKYWNIITKYNQQNKEQDKINKNIKNNNERIDKTEKKKDIAEIEKENRELLKKMALVRKEKEKIKETLDELIQKNLDGMVETKKLKNRTDYEELVQNVQLSKVKPVNLNNDQFNSLFLAFKSIKYMAPPTDTAIPVGASVLENSLTKELRLKLSENPEDFDNPLEKITQTSAYLKKKKTDFIIQDDSYVDEGLLEYILPYPKEIEDFNSQILSKFDLYEDSLESKIYSKKLLTYSPEEPIDDYSIVLDHFLENFSRDDDFIAAETRDPTSGKGLAYVVEAVMAYSNKLEVPKRSRDVLSRFVNRTPKLRDSADCAITKAVQSVNWKNYKLDVYDNNLPKGPIKLLVNVSGPFVHLMFKSQSKNALADDENLEKEIKFCLEAIGRKLRIYLNRKASYHQTQKRANLIEGYVPVFVKSLYTIASAGGKYKEKVTQEELENLIKNAIGKKAPPAIKPQIQPIKKEPVLKEKKSEEKIEVIDQIIPPPEITSVKIEEKSAPKLKVKETPKPLPPGTIKQKREMVKASKEGAVKKPAPKVKPIEPKPVVPPKSVQTKLPNMSTENILNSLSHEWQNIKSLIFKMKIKDMYDARYLQLKLKEMVKAKQIIMDVKMGKKHWKLP